GKGLRRVHTDPGPAPAGGRSDQDLEKAAHMTPWPHQVTGPDEVQKAIAAGTRRICLTTPTGGGKTWQMEELLRRWTAEGHPSVLYTNRKLLVSQTSGVLDIEHGVRAAGHEENKHLPVQVSSIQTEDARVNKKQVWQLHRAQRVLVDECHLIKGGVARGIF